MWHQCHNIFRTSQHCCNSSMSNVPTLMSNVTTPMSNFLTAEFPYNYPSTGAWLWSSSILFINVLKSSEASNISYIYVYIYYICLIHVVNDSARAQTHGSAWGESFFTDFTKHMTVTVAVAVVVPHRRTRPHSHFRITWLPAWCLVSSMADIFFTSNCICTLQYLLNL